MSAKRCEECGWSAEDLNQLTMTIDEQRAQIERLTVERDMYVRQYEADGKRLRAERNRLMEYIEKQLRAKWIEAREEAQDVRERWIPLYDQMKAENARLRAALELAVKLLRQSFADESVWDLYWAKSKEAAPLREALAGGGKCGP